MKYLPIFQISISILLILFIILQQRGGASSLIFGQSSYGIRRGIEKKVFYLTILAAIFFVIFAILNLFFK
jgi:protein translocase SecG subunit